MAHAGPVWRWEVYRVDLDPRVASEQGGDRRPAIVVSNDGFNQHFDVVTVVPLTKREGKKRRVYPFEVLLPAASSGPSTRASSSRSSYVRSPGCACSNGSACSRTRVSRPRSRTGCWSISGSSSRPRSSEVPARGLRGGGWPRGLDAPDAGPEHTHGCVEGGVAAQRYYGT